MTEDEVLMVIAMMIAVLEDDSSTDQESYNMAVRFLFLPMWMSSDGL